MLRSFGRNIGVSKSKISLDDFKRTNTEINYDFITEDKNYGNGVIEKGHPPLEDLSNKASIATFYIPNFVFKLAKFYFDNKPLTEAEITEINNFFKSSLARDYVNSGEDFTTAYRSKKDFLGRNKHLMDKYLDELEAEKIAFGKYFDESRWDKGVSKTNSRDDATGGKKLKRKSPTKRRR